MALDDTDRLVDQWVATWQSVRGITSSEVDGWPLVHVAGPSRETELVCLDPGVEAFLALTRHVAGDPRAMLTVAADDIQPYLTAPLPPGVRIDRDDESLMATHLGRGFGSPVPAGLTPRWDVEDHRSTYSLETDETLAAVGTVGVLGDVATFDRIETTPSFRRRGLGRHVMAALSAHAVERGATEGLLAASADGRLLYESLGWQTRLALLSVMGA